MVASDPAIATVDAHGVLIPRAGGTVSIDAGVKGTTISVPMRVYGNVSGRWIVEMAEGDGRWTTRTEATVVQSGSRLTGTWQWDSGASLALEGTIAANGDVLLRARECFDGFTYGTVFDSAHAHRPVAIRPPSSATSRSANSATKPAS